MPPLAIFTLGPLELAVVLVAAGILFGIPVFLMTVVVWIKRRRDQARQGGLRPRRAPGEARGP